MNVRIAIGLLAVSAFASPSARANLLLNSDFGTYSGGNLVGQNGWQQLGTSGTSPVQVQGGKVVIPAIAAGSGIAADNQDAYNTFSAVSPPASGTTSVFVGLTLTISAAQASPAYFLALSDSPGGFANERVTARDLGGGTFALGARVTGQGGFPYAYGSALNYGTAYNVVVEADLVAGSQNDVVKIFVNPTSGNLGAQVPYLTETYVGPGAGNDPVALGVVILSQFASATVGQDGLTIGSIRVADTFAEAANVAATSVPEPASVILLAAGLASALIASRRRVRRA